MRHADPRTTGLYDMAKNNKDRHASHRVASFLAGMTVSPDPPLVLDRSRPAGRANALLPGTMTLSTGQYRPG